MASAPMSNQKCHGTFDSGGSPMSSPHVGQVPSGGIELGFQNFEQSSHHGTVVSFSVSDRGHAVPPLCERTVLAARVPQPPDQFPPQVLGFHDGVDHELGRQAQYVDVLLVATPLVGHEAL